MLKTNLALLALALILVGCDPSPSLIEKKINSFIQLKAKIESGETAWVEENTKDIMSLSRTSRGRDVWEWGDWVDIINYRWGFVEDIALIYLSNGDELVRTNALYVLKHFESFYETHPFYSGKKFIDPRGPFLNFKVLSLIDMMEIFTALANVTPNATYDLDDSDFLRGELCRAVGNDYVDYVVMLITFADFDIGLVRCYETNQRASWSQYTVYKERSHYCPMSLRRISGENAVAKISARNQQFLRHLKNTNFDDMDYDVKKIKAAFYKSIDNLPDLSDVDSMNDLLDKYDKWNAGGHCTTRDLLKSGVNLPEGW